MDAAIKQRWVGALRSGEYRQGQSVLRNEKDEFCCLGVLCDLVGPERWDYGLHDKDRRCFPSAAVMRVAGVSDDSTDDDHPFWKLIRLNDTGKSFAEIADYIEANL